MDLSNSATKKELDSAIEFDTSSLGAKRDFVTLKAQVDKLDIKGALSGLR